MAVSQYVSRAELWLANSSFRSSYKLPLHFHPSVFVKWFPGHMAKGLRVMQAQLHKCDCVLEVHDARIPFSGRNPKFTEYLGGRPHVLILNKMDLTDQRSKHKEIIHKMENMGVRAIFTDCKSQYHHSVKKIIPAVLDAVKDAEYEGSYIRKDPDKPYHLLVCGLPNTGKSSLINALRRTYMRRGKGTRVGKLPGMTTSVMQKILVNDDPKTYMLDTPGITAPYVASEEVGMKLALIGCFKDHIVGEDLIADYLLYMLNKNSKFDYVDKLGLSDPCDNIDVVLRQLAFKLKATTQGGVPDYLTASVHFLKRYRRGDFGCLMLDKPARIGLPPTEERNQSLINSRSLTKRLIGH